MRVSATPTLDQSTSTLTCSVLVQSRCGTWEEPHTKWTKNWGLDTSVRATYWRSPPSPYRAVVGAETFLRFITVRTTTVVQAGSCTMTGA